MSGPLTGVRVLDLTSMISGPVATMLLGDQGADVIKVEPLTGDLVRYMGPNRDGLTSGFISSNRNKRSIAVDLKQEAGMDVVKRLVATSDVFVQNFRPGAIERMGLGEDVVREIRPDIVYVSISGFGESGPYAHKRVYDPVIQALSGLAAIQRDRETGRPKMVRTIIPDKTTALTAAQAITAALFARERNGQGQHVKLAMLDTMVAYLWPEGMSGFTFIGKEVKAARAQFAQDLIFATTDGFITAGAVSDAEWQGMCRALEREEWIDDERFNTPNGRIINVQERLRLTAEVLATRSSAEWLGRLDAEGVPCAPVLDRHEVFEHEQVRINEMVDELEHPVAGRIRQPRPAARFDRTPAGIHRHAPLLGEHTDELLREVGLDAEALRAGGVIGGG
ncbi:MAG: CoA transferase [Pseudomonadales bacterium]|nr:CoA transferase [Pseudomonadales bacterium]NIX07875.1 CoA transferase [Pseudomonadales bacterium]